MPNCDRMKWQFSYLLLVFFNRTFDVFLFLSINHYCLRRHYEHSTIIDFQFPLPEFPRFLAQEILLNAENPVK